MKRPDIMRAFLESGGKRIVAYPKEREFGYKSTDSKRFHRNLGYHFSRK